MESIDAFFGDVELLIDYFFTYIQYLNYYFIGSAVVFVVLLIMGAVVISRQSHIIKQNEYIITIIEARTLKGGEQLNE